MKNSICPICGKEQLREHVWNFKAQFEHEPSGQQRILSVPAVKGLRCDNCEETILDNESEDRISEAQRTAMGRLNAAELQKFRKQLSLSQEEMAGLLGLGKKTYCRWESPDYFQSEALDTFIRLIMFAPSNIHALKMIRREKNALSGVDLASRFPHVKDLSRAKTSSEQFELTLSNGVFRTD